MAKKGTLTREYIVERAAGLFNTVGYYRASMTDVMNATGLEKGGIYNHFASKDDLAVAAFEYAVGLFAAALRKQIDLAVQPFDKLLALIDGFNLAVTDPPVKGGCPLLNCAVENDDGNPLLKAKVQVAMERFHKMVENLVIDAQSEGEIAKHYSSKQIATFIVSSVEGGIMVSRLFDDTQRMELVTQSLKSFLISLKN